MTAPVSNQDALFAFKDFLESGLTVYLPATLFLAAVDVAYRKTGDKVLYGVRFATFFVLINWFHIRFQQFMIVSGFKDKLNIDEDGSAIYFSLIAIGGAIAVFLVDFLALKLSKVVEV